MLLTILQMLKVQKCEIKETAEGTTWITSEPDLESRWQENNKHGGAGRRLHRNRPHVKKVTVKGFSQKKRQEDYWRRGEPDAIEQQQKVFYYPF